jgi:hypothetical protein
MERRPIDILRHETGHMVMAKVLGFETGKMTYTPAHAGALIVLDIPIPDMTALMAFLKRRTMVLYAGSMAEALNSTGTDIDNEKALKLLKGAEGADDSAKAREVQRILTGVTCKEEDFANVLNRHHDLEKGRDDR